ncbi:hypothetical protein BGZ83_002596 [Gryganskiella cystojenkinii]|nr:hypothetical protein BGZ83_002596 [Gryganskiella cystojenkinii]
MDLPEIIEAIGEFLDKDTLAVATLVSSLWNRVLTPFLYRSIGNNHRQPSVLALAHNAPHIRLLDFDMNSSFQKRENLGLYSMHPVRCHNLLRLSLTFRSGQDENDLWDGVVLVAMNQSLFLLRIDGGALLMARSCWRQLFAQCSRSSLRELILKFVHTDAQGTEQLMRLVPFIAKLELERCQFSAIDQHVTRSSSSSFLFPRLKHLRIERGFETNLQQLEWIQQCPNLDYLHWDTTGTTRAAKVSIQQILRTRRWPQIQSLALFDWSIPLSDSHVALVLNSCGPLETINVAGSEFWHRSLYALRRHFETLQGLNLRFCKNVRSSMAQYLLCSASRLRCFYGGVMSAHELVRGRGANEARVRQVQKDAELDTRIRSRMMQNGEEEEDSEELDTIIAGYDSRGGLDMQSWLCRGLTQLKVPITFQQGCPRGWDEQVFEALSVLESLQVLEVWQVHVLNDDGSSVSDVRALFLDLPSGLGRLATIKGLRILSFHGSNQEMREEDLRWILNQWPSLEQISSNFHADKGLCAELRKMVVESNRSIRLEN